MAIIGIDLGTTNSTLSYILDKEVEQFPIKQFVDGQNESTLFSLPSFFYFPLPEEKRDPFVGFYAKQRGTELPDRLVSSAKSWLCHPHVDKRRPFLPLNSPVLEKISPQEACGAYLNHLKECWNRENPSLSFEEQKVILTVPASFEPMSRELVVEVMEKIGCKNFVLLEEPLAAFYAWLHRKGENWKEYVAVGDVILVVDIGGGTTDFTLIAAEEREGALQLERKAVGKHLLLGGDNIDLTLAYLLQDKWKEDLDFLHFQSFVHKCREAKEKLLGSSLEECTIVLPGRGSRLIGGAKSVTLAKSEFETCLLDGFFPLVAFDAKPDENSLTLQEMGLPYAKDPKITAHLADFLSRFPEYFPNKVLFNGGTMKAEPFQQRLLSCLQNWSGKEISCLDGNDLDFAVSKGAAYYGWTAANKGIRVRAATTKNYFIGVESARPAIPGFPPTVQGVCIAPKGMEEGEEKILENMSFSLLLEESAKFRFFFSDQETKEVGAILSLEGLTEMYPIETILEKQGIEEKMVAVKLHSKITELGMLEIWCESHPDKKWKLEFDVRKK